jgi:hypothetical protein
MLRTSRESVLRPSRESVLRTTRPSLSNFVGEGFEFSPQRKDFCFLVILLRRNTSLRKKMI